MSGNITQPDFPILSTPLTDRNGLLAVPWYYLMIGLYQKTGGSAPINTSAYLQSNEDGSLSAFETNGNEVGMVQISEPKQPALPIALSISPAIYTAPESGFIVASSGKFEISRDGGTTWFQISLIGGSSPALKGDQFRLTWFNQVPELTWMGGNT